LTTELGLPSELITWHLMTMNKYGIIEGAGVDDSDEYYVYKMKNLNHVEN
jgi:hypothetical protein